MGREQTNPGPPPLTGILNTPLVSDHIGTLIELHWDLIIAEMVLVLETLNSVPRVVPFINS